MNENTILRTLKTPNAILFVLALALLAQMPHAADVFRMIGDSHPLGMWEIVLAYLHSYGFAFALELAVLVFVVQKRQIESYCFAAVSVAMNLSYYELSGLTLFSMSALPAWLVSVALPVAIARYSHAVVETPNNDGEHSQPKRVTKTVRVTRTDEQSEQYTVVQPEQLSVVIEQPQPLALPEQVSTDEQKREYLRQLLAKGERFNKTKLATEWGVGRTTLYEWIAELQTN